MCSRSFTPRRKDRALGIPTSMQWLRRVLRSLLRHQEKCFSGRIFTIQRKLPGLTCETLVKLGLA